MIRLVALTACALAWLSTQAFGACEGLRARLYPNQSIDRQITVNAGKWCGLRLGASRGPTFGVVIVQRPAHGSLSVRPPHQIIYTANSRYTGADSFSFERKGLDHLNKPVTFTVRVAVTVVP